MLPLILVLFQFVNCYDFDHSTKNLYATKTRNTIETMGFNMSVLADRSLIIKALVHNNECLLVNILVNHNYIHGPPILMYYGLNNSRCSPNYKEIPLERMCHVSGGDAYNVQLKLNCDNHEHDSYYFQVDNLLHAHYHISVQYYIEKDFPPPLTCYNYTGMFPPVYSGPCPPVYCQEIPLANRLIGALMSLFKIN